MNINIMEEKYLYEIERACSLNIKGIKSVLFNLDRAKQWFVWYISHMEDGLYLEGALDMIEAINITRENILTENHLNIIEGEF